MADGVDYLRRQRIDIHFDAELQGGPRAHGRQRLMEAQRLTPEGLIAEGIEPEGAPAFADHSADVALNHVVEGGAHVVVVVVGSRHGSLGGAFDAEADEDSSAHEHNGDGFPGTLHQRRRMDAFHSFLLLHGFLLGERSLQGARGVPCMGR